MEELNKSFFGGDAEVIEPKIIRKVIRNRL